MTPNPTVRRDLLQVLALSLVSLFLIPALTLAFARHAAARHDAAVVSAIEARIAQDARGSPQQKARALGYYRSHPPSAMCGDADPDARDYREGVCARFSAAWQFGAAERVARWTLAGGAALLAAALALGALAFATRRLRHASFVAGWRLMTAGSAAAVTAQSAMLVWLSFWVTAVFFERYFLKLIAVAGIVAACAAFYAVWLLFRKYPSEHDIEGELLSEAGAPRLWARVRQLAARLETAPPDHIVAGIDANFFVTEAPCTVQGRALAGRTLYVSIPLLRVLDQAEADAVLAHELAHLRGGDAQSSAALGPKLLQYDLYTWRMRAGGLTVVAHYLLRLYRLIFEFALSRDSRDRELLADRAAAALVSPAAVVQSLVKVAAYANYRADIEQRLFEHDRRHAGALGIAGFVASGLRPYAASPAFAEAMKTAQVPHPFDSHPPLAERMRNVGSAVAEGEYGAIVGRAAEATWADEIADAGAIEARLWASYEASFAEHHELALACRYEPATEEEREIVLKHFPPLHFELAKGAFDLGYEGMQPPDGAPFIAWDAVKAITFETGHWGGDRLVVTYPEKALLRDKRTTIKLRGLGKQAEAFKELVGRYWSRHRMMRAQQAAGRADEAGEGAAPQAAREAG